jgi:hypothetical protein
MTRTLVYGAFIVVAAASLAAQTAVTRTDDDSVRPPVLKTDLQILARAAQILDSPAKWNRNDNRVCPKKAKTFSLYCALEKATLDVTGSFEHRGAAMQETRFAIDEIAQDRGYEHRLMFYNNDPATKLEDIKKIIQRASERVEARLKAEGSAMSEASSKASSKKERQ